MRAQAQKWRQNLYKSAFMPEGRAASCVELFALCSRVMSPRLRGLSDCLVGPLLRIDSRPADKSPIRLCQNPTSKVRLLSIWASRLRTADTNGKADTNGGHSNGRIRGWPWGQHPKLDSILAELGKDAQWNVVPRIVQRGANRHAALARPI